MVKYIRRNDNVEAIRWYPVADTETDAYDHMDVEYTPAGWFYNGEVIQPGEYIVHENGFSFILPHDTFHEFFEVAPVEAPQY